MERLPQVLRPGESFVRDSVPFSDSRTWKDILWLKKFTSLPIVLKGILTGKKADSHRVNISMGGTV